MLITVKSRTLLKLFGWEKEKLPSHVTANHKLWLFWFTKRWFS